MSETPKQQDNPRKTRGPVPICEVIDELTTDLVSSKRPPMPQEQVERLARLTAAQNLLTGAAEEHRDMLRRRAGGENITSEAMDESRRGVWGDELAYLEAESQMDDSSDNPRP